MIAFHLHARPHFDGRVVELIVYNGTPEDRGPPLGTISFQQAEWEEFRKFVVAGVRAAGFMRVPMSLEDGTREPGPAGPRLVRP